MNNAPQHLISPLKRVRGLGSAHDGVSHWWWQRVTALALIPLSIWFVYNILWLLTTGALHSRMEVAGWFSNPWHALIMPVFLLALFYHAKLGMQVIIEDYVHKPAFKFTFLFINNFALFSLAAISIFAVLKLHFYVPQTMAP